MPISDLLLSEFDEETNKTRKMLERVPAGKADTHLSLGIIVHCAAHWVSRCGALEAHLQQELTPGHRAGTG